MRPRKRKKIFRKGKRRTLPSSQKHFLIQSRRKEGREIEGGKEGGRLGSRNLFCSVGETEDGTRLTVSLKRTGIVSETGTQTKCASLYTG